jgi:hypothetical protein
MMWAEAMEEKRKSQAKESRAQNMEGEDGGTPE